MKVFLQRLYLEPHLKEFKKRFEEAAKPLKELSLQYSFRSYPMVEADSIRDESLAIAFRMVSAIKEEKSLILVSPNRKLTRMVSAYLSSWDIVPDDSAGVPLQLTPSGRFLRLVISLFTGPVKLICLV